MSFTWGIGAIFGPTVHNRIFVAVDLIACAARSLGGYRDAALAEYPLREIALETLVDDNLRELLR